MKTKAEGRARAILTWLILALALSLPALAQVTQTKPIKVKQPKVPTEKYKGVVMSWTPVSITVRDPNNYTTVHTFSFSDALQKKVQNDYMENGDKVTVTLQKGSTIAVKLNGKLRQRDKPLRVFKSKPTQ